MNYVPPLAFLSSVSAAITLPKARRPLLILIPSCINFPVAPVFFILSLPAKSTKWNFALIFSSEVTGSVSCSPYCTLISFWMIVTVKIAWDLELPSFILVALVTRCEIPLFNREMHSSFEVTSSAFNPCMLIAPLFSSLI